MATLIRRDNFAAVELPGENYIPGSALFPGRIIAGYDSEDPAYDADSWAKHILEQCQALPECTTTSSYSALNSGSIRGRSWFGYVFQGRPAHADDFEQAPSSYNVQDARAFTLSGRIIAQHRFLEVDE
ncbi:hypothetical protein BDQ12DRAFT_720258 [Crucibulum laeve]|uniref:Uncharacterized protein n=1 Tax=Crucibulum laeve TaxID=68775 RepID=A0A5C3MAE6_9AGAR|nr:hypothetical protein BDQ12DRAFT_720258 [Crucibulum laeve]